MEVILTNIYEFIMNLINNSTIYGPIIACFLIFIESILPVLPLFVFITIVFIAYGYFFGFILSYILTILGCFFSFFLCRKLLKNFFEKKIRKNNNLDKLMQKIETMNFSSLTLLISLPFTPAFLVNIVSSLSKMSFKKFAYAIFIGKIFIVFFWGFIGTSLIESLKNPKIMIVIVIMLLISYLISKLFMKKIKFE